MSTKKLSDIYSQKEAVIKNIELLETRLEMVKNKIRKNKNKKLVEKLAVLEDSKKEIQKRLDIENDKLSNIQLEIRDFKNYGEINPFDFSDTNQQDDEI